MISCAIANLLIPGDPVSLTLQTAYGPWTLQQHVDFTTHKDAILNQAKIADTYWLENVVDPAKDGFQAVEDAFDEVTPFLLGAAYATGLAVTCVHTSPASIPQLMQPSQHWPRPRSMTGNDAVVTNSNEFVDLVQRFIQMWGTHGKSHKAMVLINHWLDAQACWSMEDLYLSGSTILQVIAATEVRTQLQSGARKKGKYPFFGMVTDASKRAGVLPLSGDFKKMRNDLIHEGSLVAKHFKGKTQRDCAMVAGDVFEWLDQYLHAILQLGGVRKKRYTKTTFISLNSYSF